MTASMDERSKALAALGADQQAVDELLAYNENAFDHDAVDFPLRLPLPDEGFVAVWEEYAADARERGTFEALKERMAQLRFPVRKGISRTEAYRAATRRGVSTAAMAEATGLALHQPDRFQLALHPSLGGRIPLLITGDRGDFVRLVQALTLHGEPEPVPPSQGACTVTGYNNWDRVGRLRKAWEHEHASDASEEAWQLYFQWSVVPQKSLYQDHFVLLSDGPYSAVPAEALGLSVAEWRRLSLAVRREHECCHYLTKRVFGSMRNNLHDEIIADYMGIVGAVGRYRADWFLRFVGLESYPQYRPGGRLENYRGDPPLSDAAFSVLQTLVRNAAAAIEQLDGRHPEKQSKPLLAMALTYFTLEELASAGGPERLEEVVAELAGKVSVP